MTAKHTPGPWTFYADLPSTEPNWHIVTTANRMRVLANVHIEPGNETDLANARLIAAAPDLYAELDGLCSEIAAIRDELGTDYPALAEAWTTARAAIALAAGETKGGAK